MKLLRIAIIAQLDSATITEQLAPVLRKRGHTVDILDLSQIPKENFISQPEIQILTEYDVIYYRSGLDIKNDTSLIIELEKFLADTSVKTANFHYSEHPQAHSKTYETREAEKAGLLIPKSVFTTLSTFSSLSESLGLPFISKTDYGTNGHGVHLINTPDKLLEIQTAYPEMKLFYQSFIPHDFEYRVHIMNGEAVCVWKKAPPEGDFRSNEAQGGAMLTADTEHLAEMTELAKKTYEIFKFEIFVADFMLNKDTNEFYFTEINLNPGWGQTDYEATGVDVIGLTADYFEEMCKI